MRRQSRSEPWAAGPSRSFAPCTTTESLGGQANDRISIGDRDLIIYRGKLRRGSSWAASSNRMFGMQEASPPDARPSPRAGPEPEHIARGRVVELDASSAAADDHVGVRSDLPTGTVTFLFTDVEGSTRLLRKLGAEAYADALAEHRRVVREACTAEGGVEVDTQGDAFFFAFPSAPGAAAAARAITDALAPGRSACASACTRAPRSSRTRAMWETTCTSRPVSPPRPRRSDPALEVGSRARGWSLGLRPR